MKHVLAQTRTHTLPTRRGAILVLASFIMVIVFAFAAFSVDVGYMTLVKQELQNAADAASLAAARELSKSPADVRQAAKDVALENIAAQQPVVVVDTDVEIGVYDIITRTFTIDETAPNAVRVTTRVFDQPLFVAPVIGHDQFDMTGQAIAMLNPRDIVLVVDLSGSMNDDTEPCWATTTINVKYGAQGFPNVGTNLMQNVYNDFGFGTFPGAYEHIGAPLGVTADNYSYAEMTEDDGPLTSLAIPASQRILNSDDEYVRKEKAYKWIIANQIATLMPIAKPDPLLSANYDYWEKYLDYTLDDVWVGTPPPPGPEPDPDPDPGPQPPIGAIELPAGFHWPTLAARPRSQSLGFVASTSGTIAAQLVLSGASMGFTGPGVPRNGTNDYIRVPKGKDGDEIWNFNNPNQTTFPIYHDDGWNWRSKVGYITYAQYLMDWGRDRSPVIANSTNAAPGSLPKTMLSLSSPDCPLHTEATAGGTFQFPPREQPMHAVRRSLIAALAEVKARNGSLQPGSGDNISIVTFDGLDANHQPQVLVSLTSDYDAGMQSCTLLQAVSDIGSTTATEAGLKLARDHVRDVANGGQGRTFADDVIVLVTDGVPNVTMSDPLVIDNYVTNNASPEWYASSYDWYNGPIMQAHKMEADDVYLYAVGMGLGADYDFMDRMARLGRTDVVGQSPRVSGNPAVYEQMLIDVINEIVRNPGTRIVK